MKAKIFCYSLKGKETALKAAEIIKKEYDADIELYAPERMADETFCPIPRPSGDFYGGHFRNCDLFLSVGSVGICVRHIAPYIKSKVTDPAVIVTDELGMHVIPVLSGHIGGANGMTKVLSEGLGGEAVITTATDINGRFAVDEWAAKNGMKISSMKMAKDFAAAILERDLPLKCDLPVKGDYPPGTRAISLEELPFEEGTIGLYIGWTDLEPFPKTLRLVPKCVNLGIGCRRGTSMEAIKEAVDHALKENNIDSASIAGIASVDLKKDEAGLLEYAEKLGIEPKFYTTDELNSLQGWFTPSDFVKNITGVENVCERSAMMGSERILFRKTSLDGVTVAAGLKNQEVSF